MSGIFRLSIGTVVDLDGADAATILQNLTTNDVKGLGPGEFCETFITDVRGKMLAHVCAYRTATGFRLLGAGGQEDAIVQHLDRYTIREDATPTDRSGSLEFFVIGPGRGASLSDADWSHCNASRYEVPWLGEATQVLLSETPGAVEQVFVSAGEICQDDVGFHAARTRAGFPWYGIDLTAKNLPQEASRITQTIDFKKGCYLGQETVARLDALGQVQKQLVMWKTGGVIPPPGSDVSAGGKRVGRLTSIAAENEDTAVAIGMARRSHFEPGAEAAGDGFTAVVIGH